LTVIYIMRNLHTEQRTKGRRYDMNHVNVKKFQPQVWKRVWGEEILVAYAHGLYTGKVLRMNKGMAGGLQYHKEKDETSYLLSGEAFVDTDKGDGKLTRFKIIAGESIHIPPGSVHRVTAITDCVFFEASTAVFDDRVRVEEVYEEKVEGDFGLPTSSPKYYP
jgi:mannose-6-phosphate isomerase